MPIATSFSPPSDAEVTNDWSPSIDVRNEDEVFDDAEDEARYVHNEGAQVLCPICLGEVLNERYRIDHKLGVGGMSTIWLAHDLLRDKDVALKVTGSGSHAEHEYRIQQDIFESVQDTAHLATCLDAFMLHREGLDHWVLVLPVLGQHLDILTVKTKSMATRMSAARQLLESLEKLHNAGFVHRDVSERNCMWGVIPLDSLDKVAKYKAFGRPIAVPLREIFRKHWEESLEWKREMVAEKGLAEIEFGEETDEENDPKSPMNFKTPGDIVKAIEFSDSFLTDDFYLCDFGLSMKVGDPTPVRGHPPAPFCPPEEVHNQTRTTPYDMWGYACVFSQLYFQFIPVAKDYPGWILTWVADLIGPLPERWKGLCYFDQKIEEDCYNPSYKPREHRTLENILRARWPEESANDPEERQNVLSILRRLLDPDPEKRITATALLQDPAFKAVIAKYAIDTPLNAPNLGR